MRTSSSHIPFLIVTDDYIVVNQEMYDDDDDDSKFQNSNFQNSKFQNSKNGKIHAAIYYVRTRTSGLLLLLRFETAAKDEIAMYTTNYILSSCKAYC
jgi:hypothetical protein